MENIIPIQHGDNDLENLALACAECNLKKSSDLAGIDPETYMLTPLFHPRRDLWKARCHKQLHAPTQITVAERPNLVQTETTKKAGGKKIRLL